MKTFAKSALALAAFALASTAANAALTTYTTYASWSATVSGIGTDTFNDLPLGVSVGGPLARTAGIYSYTVQEAGGNQVDLWTAGTASDVWLSTDSALDLVAASGVTPSASAAGGYFFTSDLSGAFAAGSVIVTATDSTGASLSYTIASSSTTSFVGFTSTGTITGISVQSSYVTTPVWPTVNNLSFASAVPEPGTYGLMALGLVGVALAARRRAA